MIARSIVRIPGVAGGPRVGAMCRGAGLVAMWAAVAVTTAMVGRPAAADETILDPCTGDRDWVQLDSSEWLRGDVRRMRDRSVEFKSKKLKSQALKWKDVTVVCMAGIARYVRTDRSVVQGIGRVDSDSVRVLTATGEVVFPRDDLMAILPGAATEVDRWTLRASLGGDFNTGNTNQTSLNSSFVIRREDFATRGELAHYGSYGTDSDQPNVNRHRVEVKLDYFLTRRLYATLIESSFQYDEFTNTALRATPSTGVGYRLVDRPAFEWDVEAGLGYQHLRYISVGPGQVPALNDGVARASTYFKWTILNDLKLTVNSDAIIVMTNIGQSTNYTRAILSYEITDLFDFQVTTTHNRVWEPVANDQGVVPQKDDVQLIFSLAIEVW